MANFVTGFIARVSVSAVVGGAVAAAVVMYARDLNIERLTGETTSVSERLSVLETASANQGAALLARLDEIAAMQAPGAASAETPDTAGPAIDALRSEIAAQTKAQTETIMALHVETREAIAALRAALDAMPAGTPPADMAAEMAPVLDALTRIEAGLPTQ